MAKLSEIFQELIKQEMRIDTISKDFKWGIKIIDKTMQRERYSPLYRRDAGVVHGRLQTREKF